MQSRTNQATASPHAEQWPRKQNLTTQKPPVANHKWNAEQNIPYKTFNISLVNTVL